MASATRLLIGVGDATSSVSCNAVAVVAALVDPAYAALTNEGGDVVVPEQCARGESHGLSGRTEPFYVEQGPPDAGNCPRQGDIAPGVAKQLYAEARDFLDVLVKADRRIPRP